LYECRRQVSTGHPSPGLSVFAGEVALAAADIKEGFAALKREDAQEIRSDDVLLISILVAL
jgi:hypothetical protein